MEHPRDWMQRYCKLPSDGGLLAPIVTLGRAHLWTGPAKACARRVADSLSGEAIERLPLSAVNDLVASLEPGVNDDKARMARLLVHQRFDPSFLARERERAAKLGATLASDERVRRAAAQWSTMSFDDRMSVLAHLVTLMSASVPGLSITLAVMNEPRLGVASTTEIRHGQTVFTINVGKAAWNDFDEVVDTVAHEVSHGYQRLLAATASAHDPQARSFMLTERRHIGPADTDYSLQPREAHAVWFAALVVGAVRATR